MIKDLFNTINKIQSTCHHVIFLIDTNESFISLEKCISSLVEYTKMLDPITNKHGTRDDLNTYKRGSQIIHYILYTNELTPFIKHYDILSFDFITTSDHRSLYIDIDLALFIKYPLHQFITKTDRLVRINNPKYVTKYKAHLMKHMQQHDVFSRRQIIQTKINNNIISKLDIIELNGINESVPLGSLNAELSLKAVQESHPRYPTLVSAILHVQLWNCVRTKIKKIKSIEQEYQV